MRPFVHHHISPHRHLHFTQANAHAFSIVIDKLLQNKGCAQRGELALSEDVFGHRRSEGLWTSCDKKKLSDDEGTFSLAAGWAEKTNDTMRTECNTKKKETAFCTRPSLGSETSRLQAVAFRTPSWVV